MALHWSHASSGKHGAAGEGFSIGDFRTITQILERNSENNFECTYFRQPTIRTTSKAKKGGGLFPITIYYALPSELSDGYTDSDSESDNTANVERWLDSLPTNDAWSSAPNYSALDGSKGLEGADEIQEDTKKNPEDDSKSCRNRRSVNRDEIAEMTEWLDRQTPRKKMERTFKNRQKIALCAKMELEARNVIEKEKSVARKANIPEDNIFIDKSATWSKSNTLETTESRTAIKKPSAEEDGYDEMMQEMVNRLLTVSAHREDNSERKKSVDKPKDESFARINYSENSIQLCDGKDSEETADSKRSLLERKRARLNATFKKSTPKLAKSKINAKRALKEKQVASRRIQKQYPKRMTKISRSRNPSVTKHQPKSVEKTGYNFRSEPCVENLDPRKKTPQSRTVRFQDDVTTRTSSEAWRQTAMVKTARNKQILQTVEQIVQNIKNGENICAEPGEVQSIAQNLNSELETPGAIQLKKSGFWGSNRKRPLHSIENKIIGSRKPMFTNPFVENCLDKAMDAALSKYKCPRNTWEDFMKEKCRENTLSTAYEPPAKKLKQKFVGSNNPSAEVDGNATMKCHGPEASKNPEVGIIIKTEENRRLLQLKPETFPLAERSSDQELIVNVNPSLPRGYITDSGVTQLMAEPTKARWQVIVTSDDCALKKYCQGWQICKKAEIEECNDDNNLCTRNTNNCEESRTLTCNVAHATTSCDNSSLSEVEDDDEPGHGSILLKEYLQLLVTGDARINFITKVLSQAMHDRKTFVICGVFPCLRKPLMKRGWLEKRTIRKILSIADQANVDIIPTYPVQGGLEQIVRLLRNNVAHFIWYTTKHSAAIRMDERTMVNKFTGCYFTSKVDMCNNLENVYWFYESGVSNIQFPRCYNIYQAAQVAEFKADYRITACLGMLEWFLCTAKSTGAQESWSENGQVPITAVLFALERCTEFISIHTHEDIDREDYKEVSSAEWDQFLDWYHKISHDHGMIRKNSKVEINELLTLADNILTAVSRYRHQGKLDGMRNIWILKPGDKSLGRGIVLMDRLPDILNKISLTTREGMQYVVQKYIERPLLVYNKKVDVRQWFLITSTHPLVVWMYRDILIRFASRDFTLDDFHESIHLCNTMVQIKYRKNPQNGVKIPEELHWNLQDFKNYLKEMNQESGWDKIILPGIKQNLIGALLASQDNMANRKNSFQLYGADFVIMDDFSVWLIEINTNPRLHPPSSVVTSKLYPEVIEDIVKIVVDKRKNKRTPHGKFTCIFKQKNPVCGTNVLGQGTCLGIRGYSVLQSKKIYDTCTSKQQPAYSKN